MAKKATKFIPTKGGATVEYDDSTSSFIQSAKNIKDNQNFQYLKNAGTGESLMVSKNDWATMQNLSDFGGYNPVSANELFAPRPVGKKLTITPDGMVRDETTGNLRRATADELKQDGRSTLDIAAIAGSSNEFSSGSDDIYDDVNRTQNLSTKTESDTAPAPTSWEAEYEKLKAETDKVGYSNQELFDQVKALQTQNTGVSAITSEEQMEIDNAGYSAGRDFDPLIEEARVAREQGMGEAVVGAGQRGGMMNTQFAGTGAFIPGVGAVGRGGKLENIKSAYDMNINKLQVAKNQAIDAAKSAARQAIKSGKQADFDNATKLFNMAKDIHTQALDETAKMVNIVNSIKDQEQAATKFQFDIYKDQRDFEIGQERFDRTQAVQEGWLDRSITQDMQKKAQEDVVSMANSGIALDKIPEEKRTELETLSGFDSGSFEAIYNRAFDQARVGDAMDITKLQQAQASLSKTLRSGSSGSGKSGSGSYIKVGNTQIAETGDTFTDTVNYLKAQKDQGILNNFSYREQINSLMKEGGYEEARRGEVESMVNQAMQVIPGVIDKGNEGSDFVNEPAAPDKSYKEQGLGALGTGKGLEGLRNYGQSLWDTMEEWDQARYAPKSIVKQGWGAVSKYLFGK